MKIKKKESLREKGWYGIAKNCTKTVKVVDFFFYFELN